MASDNDSDLDEIIEETTIDEFISNMLLLCHCMHPNSQGWAVRHLEETLQRDYFLYFGKYVKPSMFNCGNLNVNTWEKLFQTTKFKPMFHFSNRNKLPALHAETPRTDSDFRKIAKMANYNALKIGHNDPVLNTLLKLQPLADDEEDKVNKRLKQIQAVQSDKGLLKGYNSQSQLKKIFPMPGIIDIKKSKMGELIVANPRKRKLCTEDLSYLGSDSEEDEKECQSKINRTDDEKKEEPAMNEQSTTCSNSSQIDKTKNVAVEKDKENSQSSTVSSQEARITEVIKHGDIKESCPSKIHQNDEYVKNAQATPCHSSQTENTQYVAVEKDKEDDQQNIFFQELKSADVITDGNSKETVGTENNVINSENVEKDTLPENSMKQGNTQCCCSCNKGIANQVQNSAETITNVGNNSQLMSLNSLDKNSQGTSADMMRNKKPEISETPPSRRFAFRAQYTRRNESFHSPANSYGTSSQSSTSSQGTETSPSPFMDHAYFPPRIHSLAYLQERQYQQGGIEDEQLGEMFGLWNTERPSYNNRPNNAVHLDRSFVEGRGILSITMYFNIRCIYANDLHDIFSRYGTVVKARVYPSSNMGKIEFVQYSQAMDVFQRFSSPKRGDVWERETDTCIFAFHCSDFPIPSSSQNFHFQGPMVLDGRLCRDYNYLPREPLSTRFSVVTNYDHRY